MGRSFNTVGGGAQTNLNGLVFERTHDLKKSLEDDSSYMVETTYDYYKKNSGYLANYRPKANTGAKKKLETDLSKAFVVSDENGLIGEGMSKSSIYDYLIHNGIDYKEVTSKKYEPDDAFINYRNNKLYIIEKKFQNGSGSVDEKLETFDYKRMIYKRLFMLKTSVESHNTYKDIVLSEVIDLVSDVEFIFIGNDFFENEKYNDVLDFMKRNDIFYFIDETMPINVLGL